MIEIKNLRQENIDIECGYLVDRRTVLGNPFTIGKDGDREQVINKYRNNWDELIKLPAARTLFDLMVARYRRNGTIKLYCWCAPKPCHADVIKEKILEAVGEV